VAPAKIVPAPEGTIVEKVATQQALTQPPVLTVDTLALVARGDGLFGTGDVVSARVFYERAAEAGNAAAALRLGETYDPSFLTRTRLKGVRGDPRAAIKWYKRAHDLGASEAEILVMGIERN
jgi:TPR repeat protein